ncbi:MAG: DNA topoisomerase I [Oceanospirillaceae bacterium]|nr:DNA topoisomerase I [Oceanospirillaceae bacterium]
MLIENIVYIIAIVCIGVLAISLNYFITNREQDTSDRQERLSWLNEQASRTLEAMKSLKEAGCKPEIIEKLNQHVTLQIEEISTLAPDSEIMTQINQKKEVTDSTFASTTHLNNDRELKRIQIYITYTERLVKQMVKNRSISTKLGKSYLTELYWLNIRNVVDAHRTQADRVLENNDNLTALSHLKHAKAIIVRAQIAQSLKQERLDDIQQKINAIEPKKTTFTALNEEDDMDNFY